MPQTRTASLVKTLRPTWIRLNCMTKLATCGAGAEKNRMKLLQQPFFLDNDAILWVARETCGAKTPRNTMDSETLSEWIRLNCITNQLRVVWVQRRTGRNYCVSHFCQTHYVTCQGSMWAIMPKWVRFRGKMKLLKSVSITCSRRGTWAHQHTHDQSTQFTDNVVYLEMLW